MIFKPLELADAMVITPERMNDERGFFARTYCCQAFSEHGICFQAIQSSLSVNCKKGTLRGMHYQKVPFEEGKLVSCIRGSIYDVIVDLRISSDTYLKWQAVHLTDDNFKTLYIPKGFAHGFQTLTDDVVVQYQMDAAFQPEAAAAFRYNDPFFAIEWPEKVTVISQKDLSYPDYCLNKRG